MEYPKRKPNRLKAYDYSQNGAYFVTVCTKDRKNLFWNVGEAISLPKNNIPLSEYGKIAEHGTHPQLLAAGGIYADMWADYQRSAQWKVGKEVLA